jgi:hypothetical protein
MGGGFDGGGDETRLLSDSCRRPRRDSHAAALSEQFSTRMAEIDAGK